MSNKHYFTFGQVHTHNVNGKVFDKDCVVEIEAGNAADARNIMFEHFGPKWAFQHEDLPDMTYYRRGVIPLSDATGGASVTPESLKIGLRVRTIVDYSGVPKGTNGEIVQASDSWPDAESVAVQWQRHPGDTLRDWFAFDELYTLEVVK